MLAMWHRVMTRPWTRNGLTKCNDAQSLLSFVRKCNFRFAITDQLLKQMQSSHKQDSQWNEIGICRPPSHECWLEFNVRGFQVGVLLLSETKWIATTFHVFIGSGDANPCYAGAVSAFFNEDGTIFAVRAEDHFNDNETVEAFINGGVILPCAASLAFINCKNVKQHDITATHGPGQFWCRRNKVPEVTYKTLLIPGFVYHGRIVNDKGELGDRVDESIDRRMHIVRGHFANYTAEAPRFGRISDGVGKFWCPSHVRGNLKNGAVVKDYEVVPPSPQTGPTPSDN